MLTAVGLLFAGAGTALVISGLVVRRAMARSGFAAGIGAMPAGAAQEGN